MKTSVKGIAALELEEGVVLRSYLCPAGAWTIGPGITSAAGVGKVGPHMQITAEQSRAMTKAALAKTYEPAVEAAMSGRYPKQNEFDAGVLFHWNTGAIHRASWVPAWVQKLGPAVIAERFRRWTRGGGKVLPGLVKRRERELAILLDGVYPAALPATPRPSKPSHAAKWALPLTLDEQVQVGAALRQLGYLPASMVTAAEIPDFAVVKFQADHALTADGIIGRATLSTLQRRIDASGKAKPVAATAAVGAPAAATDTADQLTGLPHAGVILFVGAVLVGFYLCWRYRDIVAAKVQRPLPRLATFLRSF